MATLPSIIQEARRLPSGPQPARVASMPRVLPARSPGHSAAEGTSTTSLCLPSPREGSLVHSKNQPITFIWVSYSLTPGVGQTQKFPRRQREIYLFIFDVFGAMDLACPPPWGRSRTWSQSVSFVKPANHHQKRGFAKLLWHRHG